jgi:hypothetical protein
MNSVEPLFLCLELQWKNPLLQSVCNIYFPLCSCARSEKVCSLMFGFYFPLAIFCLSSVQLLLLIFLSLFSLACYSWSQK